MWIGALWGSWRQVGTWWESQKLGWGAMGDLHIAGNWIGELGAGSGCCREAAGSQELVTGCGGTGEGLRVLGTRQGV